MNDEIQKMGFSIPGIGGSIPGATKVTPAAGENFGSMLGQMLQQVETANRQADSAVQGLLTGEAQDIHSVMLAVHKADLSLRMAMEIRNKLVEAYQEVMRMSV